MKPIKNKFLFILSLLLVQNGFAQGFLNLNFESANTSGYSRGSMIPTISALPSWKAYYANSSGTNEASQVWLDGISLGAAVISIIDTNIVGLPPLQGSYSLLLEGSTLMTPTAASVGQTGQIPLSALSLLFYLSFDSNLQVTFGGQLISLIKTGSTPTYDIWGGDVSAYAGQTGQLLFTALPNIGYGLLDNIQFSSSAIPEPSTLALGALGAFLLGFRRWRNSAR